MPDMLGYGETSKPRDAVEYSTKKLCLDLSVLLDLLEIRRVVSRLVAHKVPSLSLGR